jgi:hypothetical protein
MATDPNEDLQDSGWLIFASIMLAIGGGFNVLKGLIALTRPEFYGHHTPYAFSTLSGWGWTILVLGALELVSAFIIFTRSQLVRWYGIVAAGLNAIGSLLYFHAYPLLTLFIIGVGGLVVYALAFRWTPTGTSSSIAAERG